MTRRTALLVAALAIFGPASFAHAETLADAIAFAYRTNPELQAGRYDLRASDEEDVQARAELRPSGQIAVSSDVERTVNGRIAARQNPFRPRALNQNSDQAQLGVALPLYTGGRASADRSIAQAGIALGRDQLRGTEGDLLLAVITAYVEVRAYQRAAAVLDVSIAELEKLDREVAVRQQAGELTKTDVALADGQLAIARQQRIMIDQALQAARADYIAQVGREPVDLLEPPPLPHLPATPTAAYTLAERDNPELEGARASEAQSRAAIAAARASGAPSIAVRGTATLSGPAVPFALHDQNQTYAAGITLTVPLTNGGSLASQVRQAEDRNGAARLRVEYTRRQVERAILNAWNDMIATDRLANVVEDQRRAAATQLLGMITEYRVGLRSTFDVFYAQQTLRDAQISLFETEANRYVARAALLRRTGLLQVDTIMSGVQSYDSSRHLAEIETRNVVPWEGTLAIFDRIGTHRKRQKALLQPGVSSSPAVAPAGPPSEIPLPDYATKALGTPQPDTVARAGE